MGNTNGKMNYGEVDQIQGDLSSKDELVMISVKMEGDLLDALKARASQMHLPYQTMMKQMLRKQIEMESLQVKALQGLDGSDYGRRLESLEQQVSSIVKRAISQSTGTARARSRAPAKRYRESVRKRQKTKRKAG